MGVDVGCIVGRLDGCVVGHALGRDDGCPLGRLEGCVDGSEVGIPVGTREEGLEVGCADGVDDG